MKKGCLKNSKATEPSGELSSLKLDAISSASSSSVSMFLSTQTICESVASENGATFRAESRGLTVGNPSRQHLPCLRRAEYNGGHSLAPIPQIVLSGGDKC